MSRELTRKQFDILALLAEEKDSLSQCHLESKRETSIEQRNAEMNIHKAGGISYVKFYGWSSYVG